MFDRCDADTRLIIDTALGESRRLGHSYLGTEHLLFVLVERRDLLLPDIARLLPDAEAVASSFAALLDDPPRPDADLLKSVGIDLEAVRGAVRRTFGQSALEDLGQRRVNQPWQPWRRPARRCMSVLAGSMIIAPRVKLALARAGQYADDRKPPDIDPATLLLGMVEVEDAMSNRILRDLGVDLRELGRSLRAATGSA